MQEQNKSYNNKKWTTVVGVTLMVLAGLAALTVMLMTTRAMSEFEPLLGANTVASGYETPTESSEMHFTPGFHHFETYDESEYLNALTEIDTYSADGSVEIVDISIVYSANTVTPRYHITYKVWLN